MSQEDFAKESNVKYITLTKIEIGAILLKLLVPVLAKIAKALKTSVKNLLKIMVMTGKFEQFRGGNPHENQSSAQEEARQKLFSEEEAKLQGYRTFPNNPRAADLLAKDILGQTTEEEKAELAKYFER